MRGPNGFWCRWCGAYQSLRSKAQATTALKHTRECHQAKHGNECRCDIAT